MHENSNDHTCCLQAKKTENCHDQASNENRQTIMRMDGRPQAYMKFTSGTGVGCAGCAGCAGCPAKPNRVCQGKREWDQRGCGGMWVGHMLMCWLPCQTEPGLSRQKGMRPAGVWRDVGQCLWGSHDWHAQPNVQYVYICIYIHIYLGGTSQARRGQLRASSGGSSGDTSKTSIFSISQSQSHVQKVLFDRQLKLHIWSRKKGHMCQTSLQWDPWGLENLHVPYGTSSRFLDVPYGTPSSILDVRKSTLSLDVPYGSRCAIWHLGFSHVPYGTCRGPWVRQN